MTFSSSRLATAPHWRRAAIFLGYARDMFPSLAERIDQAGNGLPGIDRWMGHRPSTPDGLPCIGPASGCANVIHAFGHAHTGLVQAPATAKLVGVLIAGTMPPFDPDPYSARRFAR